MLEATQHKSCAFVTLTYSDDNLPTTDDGLPTVRPKDTQDWLKRFRKAIEPDKVRYFLVGEYGDETFRPHYHLALFGYPGCFNLTTQYRKGKLCCCRVCDTIDKTWGLGHVYVGHLTSESAQYVAGYTVKKMTSPSDTRLAGRHPEFARMSRRPGLGANALHDVASSILEFNLDKTQIDVPSSLRHGKKILPLGRYLQKRLRELVGKSQDVPEEILEAIQKDLSELRKTAFDNSRSFSEEVANAGREHRRQMEKRNQIFKRRKPL